MKAAQTRTLVIRMQVWALKRTGVLAKAWERAKLYLQTLEIATAQLSTF
jgi:hypothetical protein